MKNEYYSNNKVLKRTSKNNIIPHIWGFFCKFWKIFILLLPYFTIFLYFHLFISKHFETYLCTIRIIFVFVFVFVVILKNEYYSYSYSFDFEKRILFVFVFGLKLLFVSSLNLSTICLVPCFHLTLKTWKYIFPEKDMISATNAQSSKARKEPKTMKRKRANMQRRTKVLWSFRCLCSHTTNYHKCHSLPQPKTRCNSGLLEHFSRK